ncbi:MAG: STAS domain-containing protein [Bacteroidetes bacterium]|nr:STAS domain-containing protein [Bacteroidota bacterium]MCW5896439.1 STAS domain-containing protein [Bacteroidota bacterium]
MEQEFTLTSEVQDGCLVIATSGYVNNKGGEAIAQEFSKHFDAGIKRVIINLAQSKVVNSIGMSFLIEIIERLEETGGKLVFTNLDPGVEKMLSIMGLFNFAGKEKTVQDALKSFSI